MKIKQLAKLVDGLSPIEQVLKNRGITNIEEFLKHDWSVVQSPHDLNYSSAAAQKIIDHCWAGSKIAMLVDSDADGLTSSAILINYLQTAGWRLEAWNNSGAVIEYLLHEDKTHGLDNATIMRQLRDEVKPNLLIVPDASGTKEQYKALTDLGIEIVVIDHHETTERGNGDTVIVVNNQQSERYKNKKLSGAGMVWQVCRIMDEKLGLKIANNWLDLVAVGLVADVMPLTEPETRFLINEGLKPENIYSTFLIECQDALSFSLKGENYNPTNVGWYIGPLFNAVLRIGTMEEKLLIFESLLDNCAENLVPSGKRGAGGEEVPMAKEAIRQATNAKGRQKRRQDKLVLKIDDYIQADDIAKNKIILVTIDEYDADQRALSGLVANKLQEAYQRPAILLFLNKEKLQYSGSVRAPSAIEAFEDFKDQCIESNLVTFASGHQQAFGIGMTPEDVQNFIGYFNKRYQDVDTSTIYGCDFVLSANDPFLPEIVTQLSEFSHLWGQGLSEPLIAITDLPAAPGQFSLLSANANPTLKFTLSNGVEAIKFRSSKEEFESLARVPGRLEDETFYNVTAVCRAGLNEFRGKVTPQLMIQDYIVTGIGHDF